MRENFDQFKKTRQEESDERFSHDIAVQEKLSDITTEVREKFVAEHKTSPNAFDDEDIQKGVQLTLRYEINRCTDPEELKVLEDALERAKDITLIQVRQAFEPKSRINHDRERRGR